MQGMSTRETPNNHNSCVRCYGTGESVTEWGPRDCPDCGGSGDLPSRATLTEWRSRDIERRATRVRGEHSADTRWLVAELRRARVALTKVVALAMDADAEDHIAQQVRGVAYDALGLYETEQEARLRTGSGG